MFEYARRRDLGCCVLHNCNVIESQHGEKPFLVFSVFEWHSYFYNDSRVCKKLLNRAPVCPRDVRKLK